MIRTAALFACLGWLPPQGPAAVEPTAAATAAIADYRAGRHAAAFQGLQAAAAALGEAAPDELLYDLALAAVRVGRAGDAAAAAAQLDARGAAADAAFLQGLAEHQRYLAAQRAAQLADAEPMAWTAAVRAAERAAAAFRRAAELRGPWPEARRNAERLQRLAAAARAERDRGQPPPAPAAAPEPQAAPNAPGLEAAPPPAPVAPLSAAEVAELWQRLGAKEQEKRQVRRRQQAATAAAGERDW